MSKGQQQLARSGSGSSGSPVTQLTPGLTAAHFTESELHELRRVCRDSDSELGRRYLQAGIDRAKVAAK